MYRALRRSKYQRLREFQKGKTGLDAVRLRSMDSFPGHGAVRGRQEGSPFPN